VKETKRTPLDGMFCHSILIYCSFDYVHKFSTNFAILFLVFSHADAASLKDLILLILVPVLIVMAMSQYTTYLIVLIVSEKENHSLAAMKTMGVKDSAYW